MFPLHSGLLNLVGVAPDPAVTAASLKDQFCVSADDQNVVEIVSDPPASLPIASIFWAMW